MLSGTSDSDTSSAERNERRLHEAKGEEGDPEYSLGQSNVASLSLEVPQMVYLDYFHDLTGDHEAAEHDKCKSAEFRRSLVDEVKRFGKIYVEPPSTKGNPIHLQNYNIRKIQKQRAKLAYKWKITDIPYEDSDPESDRCQTPESEPSSQEDPPLPRCSESEDEKKSITTPRHSSQPHNPKFQPSTPVSDVTSDHTPVKPIVTSFPKRVQTHEEACSPSSAYRNPHGPSLYQAQQWLPEHPMTTHPQYQQHSQLQEESPPSNQQQRATKDWTSPAAMQMRSPIPELFESPRQERISPPWTYSEWSTPRDTGCRSDHPLKSQLDLLKRAITKIRQNDRAVPDELRQLQHELLNCNWVSDANCNVKNNRDDGSGNSVVETPIGSHAHSFPPRHPLGSATQEEKRCDHIHFTPKLFSDDNSTKSIESTKFMVYLSEQQDLLDSGDESDYFLSRVKVS